jgi:hypothetical protein
MDPDTDPKIINKFDNNDTKNTLNIFFEKYALKALIRHLKSLAL